MVRFSDAAHQFYGIDHGCSHQSSLPLFLSLPLVSREADQEEGEEDSAPRKSKTANATSQTLHRT
jgi:hypothetical protein